MPRLNLFENLPTSQRENVASAVLEYLLFLYQDYQKPFGLLIDQQAPATFDVFREQTLGDRGRVDFVLSGQNWLVYVENKPWSYSTIGDQLQAYAEQLGTQKQPKKILCLLATEKNNEKLLREAANVETINPITLSLGDTLAKHYNDTHGIHFTVITWEAILSKFNGVQTTDAIGQFLVSQLQDYIFPPKVELSPETVKTKEGIHANWETKVQAKVKEMMNAMSHTLAVYGYHNCHTISQPLNDSYYGWYVYDKANNGICYFIGADRGIWEHFKTEKTEKPKDYLFVVRIVLSKNGDNVLPDGGLKIQPHILTSSGFASAQSTPKTYAYPLMASTDTDSIDSEKLANTAMRALNEVRDTLAKYS